MRTRLLTALTVFAVLFSAHAAVAESWVSKMFPENEHDFGTVARGADTVFKFPVKNIYKQDIELVSVRSSCGCTTPTLEGKVLKTGETGYVVATFNTRTFEGIHSATLTVTVSWVDEDGSHLTGEAQLRVHGNIRSDVVFTPGSANFENIDQGSKTEKHVRVTYAGRPDWKITDVRGASNDLEVELTETQRVGGRVAYDLLVRLKDSAPAGFVNEQLVLVTNDSENPRITMPIEGRIVPEISVPDSIVFGDVPRGEQKPKKFMVQAKKPFKITSVNCDDHSFEFKTDDQASERHIVEVVFAPKQNPGKVKETIHIATDLGSKLDTTLTAYATVVDSAGKGTNDVTATGDQGAANASGEPKQVAIQ